MRYSYIIPVYNAENCLKTCVESILEQSFRDFEVILVNDGSTDGTSAVCRQLAECDSRIIVVNRENGGTSAARNTGLKAARGDYILFLDNDDFWDDSKALSKIDECLLQSQADVLLFWMKEKDERTGRVSCDTMTCNREAVMGRNASEDLLSLLHDGKLSVTVWTKVVKRALVVQNGITFPEGMRNEDTDFTAQVIRKAKSYDWLGEAFYVYRKYTGQSQTSEKINYSQLCDLKTILIKSINESSGMDESLMKAYYSYLAFPFAVWLGYAMCDPHVKKQEFLDMKKYAYVLKFGEDVKVRKLSWLYRFFGYNATRYALKMWVKKYRNG